MSRIVEQYTAAGGVGLSAVRKLAEVRRVGPRLHAWHGCQCGCGKKEVGWWVATARRACTLRCEGRPAVAVPTAAARAPAHPAWQAADDPTKQWLATMVPAAAAMEVATATSSRAGGSTSGASVLSRSTASVAGRAASSYTRPRGQSRLGRSSGVGSVVSAVSTGASSPPWQQLAQPAQQQQQRDDGKFGRRWGVAGWLDALQSDAPCCHCHVPPASLAWPTCLRPPPPISPLQAPAACAARPPTSATGA